MDGYRQIYHRIDNTRAIKLSPVNLTNRLLRLSITGMNDLISWDWIFQKSPNTIFLFDFIHHVVNDCAVYSELVDLEIQALGDL